MLSRWLLSVTVGLIAPALRADVLFEGGTVLTLADGAAKPLSPGYLLVDANGFLAAVGEGSADHDPAVQAAQAKGGLSRVSLAGRIVMPGFVSGHSHLWQSAFRGIAIDAELPRWLDELHRTYGDDIGPGDFGAFTLHGAYDQLRHGVTTTYNHSHWLGDSAAFYREQFDAELTTPQRFIFSWVNRPGADDATWRSDLEALLAKVDPKPANNLLGISANLTGLYRGAAYLAREIALAKSLGLTAQVHYLEPATTQVKDREQWTVFQQARAVYPGLSFAHFIHPDAAILEESAKGGAAMIWNPLSNGRLGSGLADIPKYLSSGLKVGMGVDGQASADISDPFENVRLGLYALRIRQENASGLQPVDVLRLHTLRTAQVLRVDRWVGSLEAGKFADFLVVDPGNPGTGPVWDAPATIVFACSSRNLEAVYVGGRLVVSDGRVAHHDAAALEAEVNQRIAALRARHAARVGKTAGRR